jgi:hypothetical protein
MMTEVPALAAGESNADRTSSALAFERLHALARGGYVPQIGADTVDSSIVLDHAGKAPKLRLFPDGSILVLDKAFPVHADRTADRFRIRADDESNYRKLARLVEGVPRKGRGLWRRRVFVPVLLIGIWFVSIMLSVAVTAG